MTYKDLYNSIIYLLFLCLSGAPSEKLLLGLGLYGRGWEMPLSLENDGLYCPARYNMCF